jgi:hypothetical protein
MPEFKVPTVNPPTPKLPSAESLQFNTPNVSLAPNLSAIPTNLPPPDAALKTLVNASGAPDLSLKGVSEMSGVNLPVIPPFNFPKIPTFPGMDLPGLLMGKSPKFISETLMKYQTISPPFIPGLKMNMGTIAAAASIIKSAASGGGGSIVKHLVDGIANDLTQEILGPIQKSVDESLGNVQSSIDGATQNVENAFAPPTPTSEESNPLQSAVDSATGAVQTQADKISNTPPTN